MEGWREGWSEGGGVHPTAGGVTDSSESSCDEYMVRASARQLAQVTSNDFVFQPRSANWRRDELTLATHRE